jgi:hypothetical protein
MDAILSNKWNLLFYVVAILVTGVFIVMGSFIHTVVTTPAPLTGWNDIDYDAAQAKRQSLVSYIADYNQKNPTATIDVTKTPMTAFSVATASFGGVFTEPIGSLRPYNGTVSSEAVRLQVEAGARAVTLDIWPDPADPAVPVVCCMTDINEWAIQRFWYTQGGLGGNVGRYSNWQMLTRNKVPAAEIMSTACGTAFTTTNQASDPFFLILKLHGSFNAAYLDVLGNAVKNAVGGHAMAPSYTIASNKSVTLCNTPINAFMSQGSSAATSSISATGAQGLVCVILVPDIQASYQIMPNVNTPSDFVSAVSNSVLGSYTNCIDQPPTARVFYDITAASQLTAATANACDGSGNVTPPKAGFVVVQPSVGGTSVDNASLFSNTSFTDCLKTGAQFVGVNLFSPNTSDPVLTQFFSPSTFGTYSFIKN